MSSEIEYRQQASDAIAVPGTGKPVCILTWTERPEGGIRLYASRQLTETGWGQRERASGPVDWHLDVTMTELLIVDRDTAAEAIAWVLQRWQRDDDEKEAARQRRLRDHARAGMIVNDPKALTRGLPSI